MKNWFLLAMFVLFGVTSSSAQTIEREWVDLALPSGTLWAEEAEEGHYSFDEACQKFGTNMPTLAQWEELFKSCMVEEIQDKPSYYIKLTGRNGNTLIIHPKGVYWNGSSKLSEGISYWAFTTPYYSTKDAYFMTCKNGESFPGKKNSKLPVFLVNK